MSGWSGFVRIFLVGFVAALAGLAAFVLAMNPYGNLPVSLLGEHVIMGSNQRFQFPAVIRSRRYDSMVIGTSTARLLPPASLERAFGGTFANLSIDSGMAWEQYRLADLFLREVPRPRTLVVGLDSVWCLPNADTERITFRGFPEWMYDTDPWNDLPYMLTSRTVQISVSRLAQALGLRRPSIGADGYEVFTPPESAYDAVKARRNIWGARGPRVLTARTPAYQAGDAERAAWRYPALVWLDEILDRWPGDAILAFMPVHIASQPVPGTQGAAREAECKARIAALARRHGAHVVDFRLYSPVTTTDENYWDPLHYRLPVAEWIVTALARAVAARRDDPAGGWRYLAGPDQPPGGGTARSGTEG